MRLASWFLLGCAPLLVLLASCGSSGDDDDDGGDDNGSNDSRDTPSNTTRNGKSGVPKDIKAANYAKGNVHLEVTGDKKDSFDVEGNGFVQEGFALLTYGNEKAAVIITFSNEAEPGALSLTTEDYAGAWEWDKDCKLNAKQSDDKFTGDFTCDKIDAISSKTAKTFKISVKGNFTVEP